MEVLHNELCLLQNFLSGTELQERYLTETAAGIGQGSSQERGDREGTCMSR